MSNASQDANTVGIAAPTAKPAVNPTAKKKVNEQDRAPLAITIRIFIYLVAVHFFAGFLFLLFYVAGAK
ncbi:DUF6126 family protein [Streptomyces sp. UNOC14_S4]|uniref:DUF6126 family protein n=1 Tax=Streptomyces sp. UNOC14_S4 TaxID=2872340 RepID=UPI001E32AE4A|nr:DUF6126 family protein [Streptomyces sp. UNOC14_S4]MCC3767333.1 hypothetical protein [Streptomyces sp. UNOC14_S4]